MRESNKQKISQNYGVEIAEIKQAPRQFVAETWFITTTEGKEYFVKIVDKSLFIPEIIQSLPALAELHEKGMDRINWPIPTVSGEFYIQVNNDPQKIIILFNKIDAVQSYDYSEKALGRLLAQIQKLTPQITAEIPEETYKYEYKQQFESQFSQILAGETKGDEILEKLQQILKTYKPRIDMQYKMLRNLTQEMKKLDLPKVITHGDAGGNTLVKGYEDIYIIDWDGLLLAPAERDAWIPEPIYLDGYREILPKFTLHPTAIAFYTLMYYFRSMAQYFAEIISNKPQADRSKNLDAFEYDFLEGWIVKYLERIGAC